MREEQNENMEGGGGGEREGRTKQKMGKEKKIEILNRHVGVPPTVLSCFDVPKDGEWG